MMRGKAMATVEFGAKISISVQNGFALLAQDPLGSIQRIRRPDFTSQEIQARAWLLPRANLR